MRQCLLGLVLVVCSSLSLFSQWEKVEVPWDGTLYLDVFFLPSNPQLGWICGRNGRVLRTTDGGETWLGTEIASAEHLESVHFVSALTGYVTGPTDNIYKSTDGGATWVDVSPASASALWGCYFLNADEGYVFGGTCNAFGDQRYWRTTDGGATWTDTTTSIPSSKLSDGIVYPTGVGFAVGSGELFQTLDSGASWHWFADIGANVWSEEITNVGSSFLVPLSGSDCSGQSGPNGGMRFSTDNGLNWTSFVTPSHNYGAFLHNATTGWVCGMGGQVYFTDDAGATWELRNCGVQDDDLDDIWFTDAQTGWVVGTGVYKFVWPPYESNREILNFAEICVPGPHVDTVWVRNRDTEEATWNASVIGSNFQVLAPVNGVLSGCDSVAVVVQCTPDNGFNEAQLRVTMNGRTATDLWVDLFAVGVENNLTLVDTLVRDTVNAGIAYDFEMRIVSPGSSNDVFQVSTAGVTWLNESFALPLVVGPDTSTLDFTAVVPDTGWFETMIEVDSEPCEITTSGNVQLYGLSPIVHARDTVPLSLGCGDVSRLYVPFSNTGNDTLNISNEQLMGSDADEFTLLGWLGDGSIAPGESDTLIVDISGVLSGEKDVRIQCSTNDFTTARGDKTTVVIVLKVTSDKPKFTFELHSFEIDELCVGELRDIPVATIEGDNSIQGEMDFEFLRGDAARVVVPNISPSPLVPGAVVPLTIRLEPDKSGQVFDTLRITISPCDTVFEIPLSYTVRGTEVDVQEIVDTVSVGVEVEHRPQLYSREESSITVSNIVIGAPGTSILWPSTTLNALDSLEMQTTAVLLDTGWFTIPINLQLEPCGGRDSGTMRLYGLSPIIQAPQQVELSNAPCDSLMMQTIEVRNTGNYTLTVASVSLIGADAASCTISPSTLTEVEPGELLSLELTVSNLVSPIDCSIVIEHSDTRRKMSPTTPLVIPIVMSNGEADIVLAASTVSLGTLCPDDVTTQTVTLINSGDGAGQFTVQHQVPGLRVTQINGIPGVVDVAQSVQLLFEFASETPGRIQGTVELHLPCDEILVVSLNGLVVDARVAVAPEAIQRTASSLAPSRIAIDTRNIGTSEVVVSSVQFEPPTPGIGIEFSPAALSPQAVHTSYLTIDIATETTVSGIVIVETQSICPSIDTIPVDLLISDVAHSYSRDSIDFGDIPCRDSVFTQTFNLANIGSELIPGIRASMQTTSTVFRVDPNVSFDLAPNEEQEFVVSADIGALLPGIYTDSVRILSDDGSVDDIIPVTMRVYQPEFSVEAFVDGGYVEYGETGEIVISVLSNAGVPVEVTCSQCEPEWEFAAQYNVTSSQTEQFIPISFTPSTSGSHSLDVVVTLGDNCVQEFKTTIAVQVPHVVDLIADEHFIDVGGEYALPIRFRGPIAEIDDGEYTVVMSFEPEFIEPLQLHSALDEGVTTPKPEFLVTTNTFTIRKLTDTLQQWYVSDTLLFVDFLGLVNDGGTFDWAFEQATFSGPDSVRINTYDGRHIFTGMCVPLYGVIKSIGEVKINVLGNGSNKPFLSVSAKKDEKISIFVHDNLGRVVKGVHGVQIHNGENIFDITNDLAAGIYFVEVRHLWLKYTQTVHVVK